MIPKTAKEVHTCEFTIPKVRVDGFAGMIGRVDEKEKYQFMKRFVDSKNIYLQFKEGRVSTVPLSNVSFYILA